LDPARGWPAASAAYLPKAARDSVRGYTQLMDEIIFVVEEAPEGGYTAKALGASIFTEAESLDELHANVRDAVQCHFERDKVPKMIRLHYVRDEVIAL
jgi:hypothetical protein